MKNKILLLQFFVCICNVSFGQHFAIGLDAMNIFYRGVDNPITVAVENTPMKSVVLKATKGEITHTNEGYFFRAIEVGSTVITVYKKVNGKLIKLGTNAFRVKGIPMPIFKIGPGKDEMPKAELRAQQFARAEVENFDFEVRYLIDSFKVCIFLTDSCKYIERINKGNKLSDELKNDFELLKADDIIIFKNISVVGPDGHKVIQPRLMRITE